MPFGGMLTMGAISAGSQIFGSIWGANKASKAQKAAAAQAQATQEKYLAQGRADLDPYRQAGSGALGQMSELLQPGGWAEQQYDPDTFAQDPGVAFRLQQGQQALERSAAARGGTLSGGALKSLTSYSQGQASQEYQNAWNRWNTQRQERWGMLSGVAGMGEQAAGQSAQLGANAANAISGAQTGAGNAQGAAAMAQGNAIGQAGSSVANMYMMNKLFAPQGVKPTGPTGTARLAPWMPTGAGAPSQGLEFLMPNTSPDLYSGGYPDYGYNPPIAG